MAKNKRGMSTNSEGYGKRVDMYDVFTMAEDAPNRITEFLAPLLKGKRVLDVCCGNGKYAYSLSKYASVYTGIDISPQQIDMAKTTCASQRNVSFVIGDTLNLPFKNNSFDIVICTWGIGSIPKDNEKIKAMKEMERVLKKNGSIYIIENDPFDEFHLLRGTFYNLKSMKVVSLILGQGFSFQIQLYSRFEFKSPKEADKVMKFFWKDYLTKKVTSRFINHDILVFRKVKKK